MRLTVSQSPARTVSSRPAIATLRRQHLPQKD
jgi:hypothetical protein